MVAKTLCPMHPTPPPYSYQRLIQHYSYMKTIIITHPTAIEGEAKVITQALRAGAFRIHLRRPTASEEEIANLLEQIPEELLPRVVLQDQQQLAQYYPVGGIHFNCRHPFSTMEESIHRLQYSISCHTLEEIKTYKAHMDYLFLSPIFDSLSKVGYNSAFTLQDLQEAKDLIDTKVIALGGINLQKIPLLQKLPFGGAALLGSFWQAVPSDNYLQLLSAFVSA